MIARITKTLARALGIGSSAAESDDVPEGVPLAEVELVIASMVCEGCAETIAARLEAVPGVRSVHSRIRAKRVVIQFDPARVEEAELRRILVGSGFEVAS